MEDLHPFLSLPPTDDRRIGLEYLIRQARIKAINENKCLHRDPVSGGIHTDHPSSTGLYRPRGWLYGGE